MALITCPKCGKRFSEHAEKCPQCGMSKGEALLLIQKQDEEAIREAEEQERIRKERAEKEAVEADKRMELWITVISVLAISIIFCIGLIFF